MAQLIMNQRRIDCVCKMELSRKFASVLDKYNKEGLLYAVVGYICTHLKIGQVIRKM